MSFAFPYNAIHTSKKVPVEYVAFSGDLSVGTDCTASVTEEEIVLTIQTFRTLSRKSGGAFLEVEVDYHLVRKADGTIFFVCSSKDSDATLTALASIASIPEEDFNKAISTGATLYGQMADAPAATEEKTLSAGTAFRYNIDIAFRYKDKKYEDLVGDYEAITKSAAQLLEQYPIFDARSTSPQMAWVTVEGAPGRIIFDVGLLLIIMAIFLPPLMWLIAQVVIERSMKKRRR